jgi:hypothetical protein
MVNRVSPTTAFVVTSLLLAGAARAQQSSLAALTATDEAEIRQLSTHYAQALERCDGAGYADVFAADGVFSFGSRRLEGREKLEGLVKSERYCQEHTKSPDNHIPSHILIEPSAGGATGKAYLPAKSAGVIDGFYSDVYLKTAAGWRIKSRDYVPPAEAARAVVPLTESDYLQIQQLVARYSFALDSAAENGEVYARLFTQDGAFSAQIGRPYVVRGHEKLAALAKGDLKEQGPSYARDFVTNLVIKPTADGATGRAYLVAFGIGNDGQASAVLSGGHYEDFYVKTPGGWRIKARHYVPSKLPPRDAVPGR